MIKSLKDVFEYMNDNKYLIAFHYNNNKISMWCKKEFQNFSEWSNQLKFNFESKLEMHDVEYIVFKPNFNIEIKYIGRQDKKPSYINEILSFSESFDVKFYSENVCELINISKFKEDWFDLDLKHRCYLEHFPMNEYGFNELKFVGINEISDKEALLQIMIGGK